ncbi:polysaccharide pyruvyl transferase family protein [Microbacterium sp. F2E]|uniref:polysaccharide pyruvyl transferase family protein n=1 Tax=Microbacterium sp. F2E TaxID=2895284 RepID=UPI001E652C74|nr:polysaccharide pyruvyl transferase family protein [Microbacterium sp. F2E]MCC9055274.1 polysaccharide pyruvyl transferase family protein [Microbacterium sp. F2E]
MVPSFSPRSRPRVVAVGAYERDNFGDLLYLELMRIHAGDRLELTFTAPFPADMTGASGHVIGAAGPALAEGDFDAIWTVGGEVASATLEYAYRTDFGDEAYEQLLSLSLPDQRAALVEAAGGTHYDSPYIPRLSSHGDHHAALILNSVGLGGVLKARGARRHILEATIREATFISVRDRGSHDALDGLGIGHRLAPDLAHTLPLIRSVDSAPAPYALLQLPEFAVAEHGMDAWVDAVTSSAALAQLPIRLFIAGSAPGHDRVDTAHEARDAISTATGWAVQVSETQGAWDRVDEIARSSLWIGGSLHGRIVAAAYGVPRVSIRSWKVDQYAETWDPAFPFGVTATTLADAVEYALGVRDSGDNGALALQASENLERAIDAALGQSDRATATESTSRLLAIRVAEAEALQSLAKEYELAGAPADRATIDTLRSRIEDLQGHRDRWRDEAVRLREDRNRWQDKAEHSAEDRDRWRDEAVRLREVRNRWQDKAEHSAEDRDRWRVQAQSLDEDRDKWRAKFESIRVDRDRWQLEAEKLRRDRDAWRDRYEQSDQK